MTTSRSPRFGGNKPVGTAHVARTRQRAFLPRGKNDESSPFQGQLSLIIACRVPLFVYASSAGNIVLFPSRGWLLLPLPLSNEGLVTFSCCGPHSRACHPRWSSSPTLSSERVRVVWNADRNQNAASIKSRGERPFPCDPRRLTWRQRLCGV